MKPDVTNAANEKQIKDAAVKGKNRRDQEIDDLRHILATPQGRRLMWRLISFCKVFESIWRQSAEIHYLAGRQDVGHFIMAEVIEAKDEAFLEMMKENKGVRNV